ncbi:MAG: cytochrome c [Bradyrhizobium sp.]|nr:cytochrome c [Bradyrhizobium sp.]
MTRSGVIAGVLAALVLGGAAAVFAIVWRPAIDAIDPAQRTFANDLVKRGRTLAVIGNCSNCHTAPGAKDFAGAVAVPTPFGTVFSSNITPDADTGIGRWSEAAFRRAMRDGVDREGRHLYPTFPYDHFTNVSDEDDRALYAYLMTREPVRSAAPANRLSFPFDQRPLIAGWKLLRSATYHPDSSKGAEWNRGAYLVEGLAHCGACHTPRNALGGERASASFSGGDVDNWQAYAINAHSPSPVPWDADALFGYLRNGWHPDHGTARGPMAQVVANLSSVDPDDVRAIATYMAGVFGQPSPDHRRGAETVLAELKAMAGRASETNAAGAAIYAATCASCHESGRALPYGGINLALSTAVCGSDPRNLANIVLAGISPREGERSPIMPGFASSMTDDQIVAVLIYLRTRFSNEPAWTGVDQVVAEARRTQVAALRTAAASRQPPADLAQRDKP